MLSFDYVLPDTAEDISLGISKISIAFPRGVLHVLCLMLVCHINLNLIRRKTHDADMLGPRFRIATFEAFKLLN